VIGNFLSMLAVVLIFIANLHHLAIGAVAGSYHLVPPGTSLPTGDMAELAVRMVSGAFALGFQLSAPFLVFGFAVNVGFGVLARMMPQLQVFFVVMPVNIMVGFVVMTLLIGTMMTLFLSFYSTNMGAFL
jgi:flagellar biosynthesis protein FliR